jgi:predicted RNA-binding Zn ribbon-like protein
MAEQFDGAGTVIGLARDHGTWQEPRDLASWLAAPPLALPRSLVVTAEELRSVRQAGVVFQSLQAAAPQGRPPSRAGIAAVNRLAAHPPLVPRLTRAGQPSGAPGRRWVAPATVDQVLSTLARELIGLLAGPEQARIRECAADDCGVVFVDTSRGGARRWCSMARCGNRRKVRAFRERAHT